MQIFDYSTSQWNKIIVEYMHALSFVLQELLTWLLIPITSSDLQWWSSLVLHIAGLVSCTHLAKFSLCPGLASNSILLYSDLLMMVMLWSSFYTEIFAYHAMVSQYIIIRSVGHILRCKWIWLPILEVVIQEGSYCTESQISAWTAESCSSESIIIILLCDIFHYHIHKRNVVQLHHCGHVQFSMILWCRVSFLQSLHI